MKLITLTDEDVRLLKELAQKVKTMRSYQGSNDKSTHEWDVGQSPDVYLALTPAAGIAAAPGTGGDPVAAECQIYRVDDILDTTPTTEAITGLTKTVYNFSENAITGSEWIVVIRDKFGTWIAVDFNQPGSGVSSSSLIDISGRSGSVADVTAAQFLRTVVSGTPGATVVTPDDASASLPGDVSLSDQTMGGGKKTFVDEVKLQNSGNTNTWRFNHSSAASSSALYLTDTTSGRTFSFYSQLELGIVSSFRVPVDAVYGVGASDGITGTGGSPAALGGILITRPASGTAYLDDTGNWSTPTVSNVTDGDKGDITVSGGVWTIDNGVVTPAKMDNGAACSVLGRSANSSGVRADIAGATNDRVFRRVSDALDFGQLTVGMAPDDLWTYAKLQNISTTQRALGRNTALAGDIEEVTISQMLDWLGGTANGDIPYRTGGTWDNLAIGTQGKKLEVNSSGLPAWTGAHGCRIYRTTNQTISTATVTAVSFDAERNDTDTFHDNSTNPTRMTIPTGMGGRYSVGGAAAWDTTGSPSSCAIGLLVNGTTLIAYKTAARLLATNHYRFVHTEYVFAAADYIELVVWQNSGGNVDIIVSANIAAEAWLSWIGP